jgi:hypothetical protein
MRYSLELLIDKSVGLTCEYSVCYTVLYADAMFSDKFWCDAIYLSIPQPLLITSMSNGLPQLHTSGNSTEIRCYCQHRCGGQNGPGKPVGYSTLTRHKREAEGIPPGTTTLPKRRRRNRESDSQDLRSQDLGSSGRSTENNNEERESGLGLDGGFGMAGDSGMEGFSRPGPFNFLSGVD